MFGATDFFIIVAVSHNNKKSPPPKHGPAQRYGPIGLAMGPYAVAGRRLLLPFALGERKKYQAADPHL